MNHIRLLLASLAFLPLGALAASPFDGTWKTDYKTSHIIKNAEWGWEIKDGKYHCTKTCYDHTDEVATDGKDHPVKNHTVSTHLAVELKGDSTAVLTYKKAAKRVVQCTLAANADGSRLTQTCTDYTGTKPVENSAALKRVGTADAAAHKTSGVWTAEEGTWTGSDVTITFAMTADGVKITQNGVVIDAKFDGKEYPSRNDPGHTLNVIKKVSDREIEWLQKVRGKDFSTDVLVVNPDGQSILDTYIGHTDDTKNSAVLRKVH